jgi:Glycosyl transferase family 2
MDSILWAIGRADGVEVLGTLWRPLIIGLVLYYSGYFAVWFETLARTARVLAPFRGLTDAPDVLIVLPTLLKTRADVDDLREATATVIGNRYPGRVVICLAIDGTNDQPALVDELEAWATQQHHVYVARVAQRSGKGVAVVAGLERCKEAVAAGQLAVVPSIFFNMDADGVLGPRAIERMVAKLVTPGRIFRTTKPMIVASNVLVRRAHYWNGVRDFFTMRYQLALQVAREYMTSISVSRNNRGLLPVTGVSGALYCTWTDLHEMQPYFVSYIQSLRRRDVLWWWLGRPMPKFASFTGAPNIRATAGPGDDTWMAWFAMFAHWRVRDGVSRIDVELPRTPLHAFARLVRSFFLRQIAYDPLARVYTATPTTVRALFTQRIRWNSSRPWLANRFGIVPYVAWELGAWILLDLVLLIFIHIVVAIGLLGWPFADRPAMWIALLVLSYISTLVIRGAATLLAMIQDHDIRGHWHKLLSLPLAGPYHVVFNILTTIVGFIEDFFLFGVNTHFAPEETIQASKVGRIALAYRICRFTKLSVRAVRYGDVPFGWFWFGFHATPYTASGYAGWTNPAHKIGRGGVLPSPLARRSSPDIVRA